MFTCGIQLVSYFSVVFVVSIDISVADVISLVLLKVYKYAHVKYIVHYTRDQFIIL